MPESPAGTVSQLKADYTSPNDSTHTWSYPQHQLPDQPSTQERVTYLRKLRSDVTSMQESVNKFLTEKMDEEKRAVSTNRDTNGVVGDRDASKVDENREEENYGEEVDET